MITYLFFALLVGIIVWRVILPGMKMEKTRATVTPVPGASGETATTPKKPSVTDKLKSNIWTVLLIVVGGGVVLWGFYRPVHLTAVMSWREYWFSLVVLWGVLAALVAINAEKAMAETLQKVLAGVMIALLVVLPIWARITSPSAPPTERATRSEVPLATSPQSEWPKLVIPPGGKGVIQYSEEMVGKHLVLGGKFVLHSVYSDGRECTSEESCEDGPQTHAYVKNASTETLIVPYAFAPN